MDFTDQIKTKLTEKGLTESSIKLYVRNLEKLNNKQKLKDLKFLNKVDDIMKRIEQYKPNSQRTYLISIVSVLNAIKGESKPLAKLYKTYYDKMIDISKSIKETPTEEKSETQKENWLSWDDVKMTREQLLKDHTESPSDFNTALQLLLLSLYTELQPRRNQDYQQMFVVKKYDDSMPNDKNYLSLDTRKFVFNQYKTSKKYGKQIVDIPDSLYTTIESYLKVHPLNKGRITKSTIFPFLVNEEGQHLNKVNSITRILNRIFGRHVGSSMLRHIFITDKYDGTLQEMKEDANVMGHSVEQQRDYAKTK